MTSYEVTDVVLNSLRSSVNNLNPGYFIVEAHIVKVLQCSVACN